MRTSAQRAGIILESAEGYSNVAKRLEVAEWNSTFAYGRSSWGWGSRWAGQADLVEQLVQCLGEVNEQRPCLATNVIPALRWGQERPRLRPLKVTPENLAIRVPVQVGPILQTHGEEALQGAMEQALTTS